MTVLSASGLLLAVFVLALLLLPVPAIIAIIRQNGQVGCVLLLTCISFLIVPWFLALGVAVLSPSAVRTPVGPAR